MVCFVENRSLGAECSDIVSFRGSGDRFQQSGLSDRIDLHGTIFPPFVEIRQADSEKSIEAIQKRRENDQ